MRLKALEETLKKAPFVPFDIHIDGKNIRVTHPEQVLFNNDHSMIVVASRDNFFHIIDVDRIEFLTLGARRSATKKPA